MNNGLLHQNARRSASRLMAIAFSLALMTSAGVLLSSCGHEPEKATPPSNTETTASNNSSNTTSDEKSSDDAKADAEKEAADKAAAEAKAKEEEAAKAKHQGAYVTAIRNGGGADGLAAAAQTKLVGAGLAADTHTYSLDSYAGGLAPATVVYVKGTGDDAADVKAEAEKMVAALGVGSVQTFDQAAAGGETMDNTDILVVIGQDAVGAL